MSAVVRNIELLAPAKDLQSAVDAVDCGADAVYIGAAQFGARHAATNSVEDIAKAAEYAHRYGAKVYATLNTLIFDDELEDAKAQAEALVAAGVDALIVQDMAYCRMGLNVPLHASTQTACSTVEQVRFFEQVGFERAILERNLSGADIENICRKTGVEIEAFIHGAICVCHSGRCYLSRSMSDRSGNRGQCSQPCRLPYDLTDGNGNIYIKGKHLLSVTDLDLSQRIGQMLSAGVNSFKIEGRLKDRVYLRNVVSHYRRLLDEQIALHPNCRRASVGVSQVEFTPNTAKSFTRGGGIYLFDGKRAGVASFDTPKALGERIGSVTRVARNRFMVDGNLQRLFTASVERSRIRRAIEASVRVEFTDKTITVTAEDCTGVSVSMTIDYATEVAKNTEKMTSVIREQMSKSGDTIFDITRVDVSSVRFVPASVMASLRRELLTALECKRVAAHSPGKAFVEELSALYPHTELTEQDNVTNALARQFYTDHGVKSIQTGLDLRQTTVGSRVMVTDYCIRREIGQCLLKNPTIRGELFLERGRKRYKLAFDCKKCQMSLIDTL